MQEHDSVGLRDEPGKGAPSEPGDCLLEAWTVAVKKGARERDLPRLISSIGRDGPQCGLALRSDGTIRGHDLHEYEQWFGWLKVDE